MAEYTRTVRVSLHVLTYLGSHVTAPAYTPAAQVATKAAHGRQLSNGARAVELTTAERAVLRGHAERMAEHERASHRRHHGSLGAINAAAALLRQLDKIAASEAMLDRLCTKPVPSKT